MYGLVIKCFWNYCGFVLLDSPWVGLVLPSPRQLGLQASSPADANVLFLRRSLSPTPPGAPYRLHVVDRWTIKKDLFHRVQGLLFLLIFIQKCLHIIHNLASIKRNEHLVNSAASYVSWLMASLLAPSPPSPLWYRLLWTLMKTIGDATVKSECCMTQHKLAFSDSFLGVRGMCPITNVFP